MRNSRFLFASRDVGFTLAAAAIVLSPIAQLSGAGSAPEAAKPKTAAEVFKNVQVLKDVPSDDLLGAMQFITASLGVECEFCHVRNAFDKDDKKPKQTARKMMQMMFAINQQNFNGEAKVSCYSCHRGSTTPLAVPMVGDVRAYVENTETPASVPGLPSADEILQKYVAALGGASAIEKISTRIESGKVSFGSGPALPVKITTKAPDKQIMTVQLPAGDANTAFNSVSGWTSSPGTPVRDMHAVDFEGARLDADLQLPIHLSKVFRELKPIKTDKVGDRDVFLVLAGNPGQPPVEFFFDKNSGLLLRQLRFGKSPLGLNPTRVDYDEYKEFDGVKVPMKVSIARPRTELDIHLDEVAQNQTVDDSLFEKPVSPPKP